MMEFDPFLSWPLTYGITAILVCLLAFIAIIVSKSDLPRSRKFFRITVNSWLIISLAAFLLQPLAQKTGGSEPLILHRDGISPERLASLKDSLKVTESLPFSQYKGDGNPIFLIGQDFSVEELLSLGNNKNVQWIPELKEEKLQSIQWEGLLRQGDQQVILGNITLKDSTRLAVQQFGETIAEQTLSAGHQVVKLDFPVRIPGRNKLDFVVDGEVLDSVLFFVAPASPVKYRLEFGAPNAEGRHLTDFLSRSGHKVDLHVQVSTHSRIQSTPDATDPADVLIIDPSQAQRKDIQQAMDKGSNLLVINFSDPQSEFGLLNKYLGTNFQAERTSRLEQVEIGPHLYAWPYRMAPNRRQRDIIGGLAVYEHVGHRKVAVSLLETYPMALSGDSTRYTDTWQQLLSAIRPVEKGGYRIAQPVFAKTPNIVRGFSHTERPQFLVLNKDSIALEPSRTNIYKSSANWIPDTSGWLPLNDSLEVFVYDKGWEEAREMKKMTLFQSVHESYGSEILWKPINGWIWLMLLLLSLGMVWVEPRL